MDPAAPAPSLEPGITLLERPSMRSAALHHLLLNELQSDRRARTMWIDARDNASTRVLYDMAPDNRMLDGVRIARAYTAYQHHTLVRRTVEQAHQRPPDLVVAPCPASLYQDPELEPRFGRDLLASSMTILRELADVLSAPVLVTTTGSGSDCEQLVADQATTAYTAEKTSEGLRYVGDDYETTVYWSDGQYMQTTIDYWVDLFGCVCDSQHKTAWPTLDSVTAP